MSHEIGTVVSIDGLEGEVLGVSADGSRVSLRMVGGKVVDLPQEPTAVQSPAPPPAEPPAEQKLEKRQMPPPLPRPDHPPKAKED